MDLHRSGDVIRADSQAREQFYDARGYGRPVGGDLELAPVEAAHLLFRGDVDAVDGEDFRTFLTSAPVSVVDFLVYKDLRDRGFYCSPAREGWVDAGEVAGPWDFVVYPRGDGPWDDGVAYRVRAVSERVAVTADTLLALADGTAEPGGTDGDGDGGADGENDSGTGVVAVVDEESELTYLGCERRRPTGSTDHELPSGVPGRLLDDRVLVPDPPAVLHERAFYGQPLEGDGAGLGLSLVEAAALAEREVLAVDGGPAALRERGRDVEGERFDRRLRVYRALRSVGVVPKTGFKFGADFRTYAAVEDVADLGHSELLVRVVARDRDFDLRDLALDVRLAHGVRKRMVFALVAERGDVGRGSGSDDGAIEWLSVERLTP